VTCERLVVSSTNKTDRHDIAEIVLKVTLNTINQGIYKEVMKLFLTYRLIKTCSNTVDLVYFLCPQFNLFGMTSLKMSKK
jgi:hypothetical protein